MIRHFISYFLPFVVYLVLYSSFNLPSKAEWLLYISPALTCHNSEFYTEACLSLPYRNKNDCFPKQHYWVDIHVFPMRYELNFYILFRGNSVFKGFVTHFYDMYVTECLESGPKMVLLYKLLKLDEYDALMKWSSERKELNLSLKKIALVPLCPPKLLHGRLCVWTVVSTMRTRRL